MNKQLVADFIKHAIEDTQSTIRQTDAKVAVLFLVSLAPLSQWRDLKQFSNLCDFSFFTTILAFFSGLLWAGGLVMLARAVSPISVPQEKPLNKELQDFYFGAGLFWIDKKNIILNSIPSVKVRFKDYFARLPQAEGELIQQLAFEKYKLSYIRDIKLKRAKIAIWLTIGWMVLGAVMVWSI